jgi:alkylation response protein AidB-like acyl-CoA dehydrogenase
MTDASLPGPTWSVSDPHTFHRELQAWTAQHWNTSQTVREWWALLASAGLTAPTWSRVRGGLSATASSQEVVEQELARVGAVAPPLGGAGIRIVAPVLREHGTAAHADLYMGPMLRGEHGWCLMVDEPNVDDFTAVECRLTIDDGRIHVDGRKTLMFSRRSDLALLVGRSDPDAVGPRGLTCVIVDMAADGVTAIDDQRVVVRTTVDRAAVVGEVGEGYAVVRTIASYVERSLAGRIRRGLTSIEPGTRAGQLDRSIAVVLDRQAPPWPPPFERRRRTD